MFIKELKQKLICIKYLAYVSLLCALSFYIYKISVKYFVKPDVSSMENSIQASTIPFPGFTICSPFMMKSNLANSKRYQIFYEKNNVTALNLSVTNQNYLSAKVQVCSTRKWRMFSEFTQERDDFDIIKLLRQGAPSIDDIFPSCNSNHKKFDCNLLLNRVLTDYGMCYSFNVQSFKTIFNEAEISSDFHSYKNQEENATEHWSLEKGYTSDERNITPYRSILGAEFKIFMAINETDLYDFCEPFKSSFKVFYHMPNEIITIFHESYNVNLGFHHEIKMTAKKYKSHLGLRKYPVGLKQCYFEGERKLQFFKTYTKSHCNIECVTNFTLRRCGCVKYSYPRTQATPVCDLNMTQCYVDAISDWPKFDEMSNSTIIPCDCYPPCSEIWYSIKNSHFDEHNENTSNNIRNLKAKRK